MLASARAVNALVACFCNPRDGSQNPRIGLALSGGGTKAGIKCPSGVVFDHSVVVAFSLLPMWTRPTALISNSTTYPAVPKGKISSRTNGSSSFLRQLNGLIAKNWHACRFSRTPVGLFSFHPKAKSNNLSRSSSASRLKTI